MVKSAIRARPREGDASRPARSPWNRSHREPRGGNEPSGADVGLISTNARRGGARSTRSAERARAVERPLKVIDAPLLGATPLGVARVCSSPLAHAAAGTARL